ncbi:sodium/sulfate transporter, putative [Entamoeba invadens IP1]|uniref:Sodium/sulfate transporter, putative n=1 Tax=Entamoeba invadens IP1 TaxID=370355 RepID=A0A0A1U8Q5_ENTIV|nr:sodium/sulfate transporter, putative [Entamoeba invadens IP1]ELP91227.1 sodium/sulfate transporter, putative [Entamoeba invadens IP1]|eukprot:XP_004257998.1 sodium/sulfate transporter, putative [Entamoeba invadens IP1]
MVWNWKKWDLIHVLKILAPFRGTLIFFIVFTIIINYLYYLDWYTHYETQLHSTTYLFLMIFDVMMTVLIADLVHPGIVVFLTVSILLALGVIDLDEAFVGFSDSSTLTVMVALILSAGINKVQLLEKMVHFLLPSTKQYYVFPSAMRFLPFVMALSLFLNNTPVVAMSIPLIQTWAKTSGHSAKKMLMPVSFCAIFGGMNSILGTSTNLVGRGLVYQQVSKTNSLFHMNLKFEMPLFEIGLVACPVAIVGYLYCCFCTSLLDRNKEKKEKEKKHEKTFFVHMKVTKENQFIGTHLHQTPLCNPPNGRVVAVKRKDIYEEFLKEEDGKKLEETVPIVLEQEKSPDSIYFSITQPNITSFKSSTSNIETNTSSSSSEMISENSTIEKYRSGIELTTDVVVQENDILIYEIPQRSMSDVLCQKGLKLDDPKIDHITQTAFSFYEVCLPKDERELPHNIQYSIIGVTGREDKEVVFPSRSWIVAVPQKYSKTFPTPFLIAKPLDIVYLVDVPLYKTLVAVIALAFPILMDVFEFGNLVEYALFSVLLLLIFRVLTVEEFFGAIDIPLFCILGASFGLSTAMVKTNSGSLLALTLTRLFSPFGKLGVLAALYIPTLLLTQPLSNTAVVAVMFPVVWAAYWGKDPLGQERGQIIGLKSGMYTMMLAASEVFVLPIGYQTNMMVMEVADYSISDFVVFGTPLMILSMILSVTMPWLVFEVLRPSSL